MKLLLALAQACCCCLQVSTDEPICDGWAYALCLASAQHCPTDADPCKQLLWATCPVRNASFSYPSTLPRVQFLDVR